MLWVQGLPACLALKGLRKLSQNCLCFKKNPYLSIKILGVLVHVFNPSTPQEAEAKSDQLEPGCYVLLRNQNNVLLDMSFQILPTNLSILPAFYHGCAV